MKWLNYRLYIYASPPTISFSKNDETIWLMHLRNLKLSLRTFYFAHRNLISGILLFHYDESHLGDQQDEIYSLSTIQLAEHDNVFFVRVRFRTTNDSYLQLQSLFKSSVLDQNTDICGWRMYDSYEKSNELGKRFGDLASGNDPNEQILLFTTASVELMFYFLDFPTFHINHDVIHLYLNTIGCNYPEEIAVLQNRIKRVRKFQKLYGLIGPRKRWFGQKRYLLKYS